jgi:hypothetical protein
MGSGCSAVSAPSMDGQLTVGVSAETLLRDPRLSPGRSSATRYGCSPWRCGETDIVGPEERTLRLNSAHSGAILFARPIYLFIRNETTQTFERHESTDSGASRYKCSTGERPAASSDSTAPVVRLDCRPRPLAASRNVVIDL